MAATFQRRIEDFVCEHCGSTVIGNGYTNHCHQCLWSKHVDIQPGDRAAECGGMMKPLYVEGSTGNGYSIMHRCEKCGKEMRNSVAANDDEKTLLTLASSRQ